MIVMPSGRRSSEPGPVASISGSAPSIAARVGINLYVVQGLRKRGKIDDVIIGASPFVITMLLMIIVLSVWPRIALFRPQLASG